MNEKIIEEKDKEIERLKEENQKLKNDKKRVLEYIEKCMDSEDIYEQFLSTDETERVLKMLRG
jgi:hypothetical protein